jgi:hypothetical protein
MRRDFPGARDLSAAALLLPAFAVVWLAVRTAAPPTPGELQASDPIVQGVNAWIGLWGIPLAGLICAAAWLWLAAPGSREISSAADQAGWALALVALLGAIGILSGRSTLPDFVPPEESAAAGLLLGLGAAIIEEALFRLTLLPVSHEILHRVLSPLAAAALSIVVTSVSFALAHEIGPGAGVWSASHFAVRFLFPGCIMSALAFRPGPAFPVALHCSLHLVIPFVFQSPRS